MSSIKRPGSEMTSEPKRSAWQQPASCEFCRLKKIRCDKRRPCSNCTTRNFRCEYALATSDVNFGGDGNNVQITPLNMPESLERHLQEMNDRLKRLEQLLLRNLDSSSPQSLNIHHSISPHQHNSQFDTLKTGNSNTWDHLEAIAAAPHSDGVASPRLPQENSPVINEPELDFASKQPQYSSIKSSMSIIANQLPKIDLARSLLEHYVQAVDCLHREIHAPSTRNLLETTYTLILHSIPPTIESLTLLICIFASSAFYIFREDSPSKFDKLKLNPKQHHIWKETAMKMIMGPEAIFSLSMESLQSTLIMLYLLWDSEGQSERFHALKGLALTKTIQMKIHKMDIKSTDEEQDMIRQELRRRLWWHLACTDWLLASISGPQEGIYNINPHQMTVDYPSNLNDEDLKPGQSPPESQPADQPTSMSFFLQRIRFAELCRETVDCLTNAKSSNLATINYDLILRINKKFISFLNNLPWFFRLDEEHQSQIATLATHCPYILRQRTVLLYGFYSRLGRLHRPFIYRGITELTYSTSHQVGVECAEKLLSLHRTMETGDFSTCIHSHSLDQHLFNALLLLTIDVMAHHDLAQSDTRRSEIVHFCCMLKDKYESLGQYGNGISRAVKLLLEILHKSSQDTKSMTQADSTSSHSQIKGVSGHGPYAHLSEPQFVDRHTATKHAASSEGMVCANDFSSLSFPNKDISDLFDELRDNVSNSSDMWWEEFFDWQGSC